MDSTSHLSISRNDRLVVDDDGFSAKNHKFTRSQASFQHTQYAHLSPSQNPNFHQTRVRLLQVSCIKPFADISSSVFVLYISAPCDDAKEGKKLLHETVNALFSHHSHEESGIIGQSEMTEESKPNLLLSALYIQDLCMGSFDGGVVYASTLNGNLNYDNVLTETEKLFKKMYPVEEYFPKEAVDDNFEDEAGEMLHVTEAFIDKSFHPTVICRAYNKALEDAIAVLDSWVLSRVA